MCKTEGLQQQSMWAKMKNEKDEKQRDMGSHEDEETQY